MTEQFATEHAFPSAHGAFPTRGMTLRDYFAGQALVGISAMSGDGFSLSPEDEASWAYQRADAMIKARGEQS